MEWQGINLAASYLPVRTLPLSVSVVMEMFSKIQPIKPPTTIREINNQSWNQPTQKPRKYLKQDK